MKKTMIICLALLLCVCVTGCASSDYKDATALYNQGDYVAAIEAFEALGDYKDSPDMILACKYAQANALLDAGDYDGASAGFKALGDYQDAPNRVFEVEYEAGMQLLNSGECLVQCPTLIICSLRLPDLPTLKISCL